jgi:predicted TIM-barrel fold metal-dependent hydrolase
MPDRRAWLAQVEEEIIEPDRPICDPHHHLWDHPGDRYLFEELLADLGIGHNVASTVFVEVGAMYRADGPAAMRVVGETEFVQGVAAMSASGGYDSARVAASIVGHVDLRLGDGAQAVLEAQVAASPERFHGIRHASAWDADARVPNHRTGPSEGLLLDDTFRAGFRHLAPLGLTFDAWLYHPQIPDLVDLARAFTGTTIILDHFGGPLGVGPYANKADQVFADWKRNIAPLAELPNVMAKLGGINMPINGFGWHHRESPPTSQELAEATKRYYLHTIDLFGPERCMFESNFPVDKASCSYAVLWNAFKRIVADFPGDERDAMFHDTAARVYRTGV